MFVSNLSINSWNEPRVTLPREVTDMAGLSGKKMKVIYAFRWDPLHKAGVLRLTPTDYASKSRYTLTLHPQKGNSYIEMQGERCKMNPPNSDWQIEPFLVDMKGPAIDIIMPSAVRLLSGPYDGQKIDFLGSGHEPSAEMRWLEGVLLYLENDPLRRAELTGFLKGRGWSPGEIREADRRIVKRVRDAIELDEVRK